MSRNTEINQNKTTSLYQKLAQKYSVSVDYVGMIARGQRVPKRGKGLQIQESLKQIESIYTEKN